MATQTRDAIEVARDATEMANTAAYRSAAISYTANALKRLTMAYEGNDQRLVEISEIETVFWRWAEGRRDKLNEVVSVQREIADRAIRSREE